MPHQYTFTGFDPREFEFLCRDLLQRKITEESGKPFFFNSFSEGADGGIDAIFEDNNQKIILQCKRYSDFKALYNTLKSIELPKVIKLNPTRYIIATSCKLSQKQVEKIYLLFKSFVQDMNDVLGQTMINNLLAVYPEIELNYPRLYLNSGTLLNRLLQANVYNQSIDKLKQYQKTSRFYVPDGSFQHALKILNEKKYVIISGEPGVGKSTLAGMLSLYYLEKVYEFIFLRRSVSEAEGSIWNEEKKQIFLFDDFLGSTTFEGFDRNEDRQLLDFINKIVNSSNKLLLITTREYVFKQAEAIYPELKKIQFTKCLIRQKEFTSAFKINILYNYLYYSKIELKHIEPVLYNERYKQIIYHNNFTPRLISDYIERYYDKFSDSYSLYFGLERYLDDPYTYWEEIFLKLNENARMLLLIMVITQEPAIEELLFQTFVRIGAYREIYKKGYEKDSFEQAIAELSESFISISHNPDIKVGEGSISSMDYSLIYTSFRKSKFLEFQNPSIKDFAVNYLRKREDLISFLIHGATLFNQLYFVFTTIDDDKYIEDYDADISFSAGKIILSTSLCNLVLEKMIAEFDTLPIAKVRRINWEEGTSSFHLDIGQFNNRMDKLWNLCHYFPLGRYEAALKFVKEKYEQLLYEDKMRKLAAEPGSNHLPLSLDERITQTDIIKKLYPFVLFDPLETVKAYYHNIRFAKEFIFLHFLHELFPGAYHELVTINIREVRREIKEMIYDDIDYYLWEGTNNADDAIDELVNQDLEELMDIYKFKLSKKSMKEINDMSDRELFRIDKIKGKTDNLIYKQEGNEKELPQAEKSNEQKYKSYELALKRLIPQWVESWYDEENAYQYIRSKVNDSTIAELLVNRITSNQYYKDMLNNIRTVDLLLSYLNTYKEEIHTRYLLYEQTLLSLISKEQLNDLQAIAYNLYINDLFTFRKETFENAKNNINATNIIQYSKILEQQDIWYRFPSRAFHIFLSVRHITSLSAEERINLYTSLKEEGSSVYYENQEIFWQFCYEADKDLFCTHFIVPVFQAELKAILKDGEDEMAISYLKKHRLDYEFDFWEEKGEFELDCSGGGNVLLEDITRSFEEWNIPTPSWEIADCFNISQLKNTAVKKYIQQYCPVTKGKYKIDITHELKNVAFRKLLKQAGVTKIIVDYVAALKNAISCITKRP